MGEVVGGLEYIYTYMYLFGLFTVCVDVSCSVCGCFLDGWDAVKGVRHYKWTGPDGIC